jgi:hypothetical protein
MRRCGVPSLDDRGAALPLDSARPGRGLQPRQVPRRQCGVPPTASPLPLKRRARVVCAYSRFLGGFLRRAPLGVEPRPYVRRDRGRLDAVPTLQLDLGTILPLEKARCWRCRSSGATALARHASSLAGRRGGRDVASSRQGRRGVSLRQLRTRQRTALGSCAITEA